jgi:hypothetical protein
MTYAQIVSQVASDYGLRTQISVKLAETVPSVTQAGVSDYEFLTELAKRSGVDFFVSGDSLIFMRPALLPGATPAVIDITEPGVESVVFSVDADGKGAQLSSSPINPRTGQFVTVTSKLITDNELDIDSKDQIRFQGLARPRIVYMDGRGNLLSQSALQTMLDADANKRKNIVKCRATITGEEKIMPRQTIAFLNCGSRFMGPYYITKTTHEIRGGKFTTTFEGMRATTGQYLNTRLGGVTDSIGGTPTPYRDVSYTSQREIA